MFTRNVGNTDRIIRLVLGLAIVALAIYFQFWIGLIAIIFPLTALVGWCPLYQLFGLNTCSARS
jgi:hypothetical protein